MAQRNVQDEGLFPGVDLLTMAIQAEKQEKAEKQQRQEMYLQGLQLRRQQEASALAAQREARISAENQRKADISTQIAIENLKNNQARLALESQRVGMENSRLTWDQKKANAELTYKMIADARNRMQHRADMMQNLNIAFYGKVVSANNPQQGYANAKKDLEKTKNTFSALRSSLSWWDRNPSTRGRVFTSVNDAGFNQMFEIPGIKKAMEGLDQSQQKYVMNALTKYAMLPAEERPAFLGQIDENEKVATTMTTTYNGFQDPKQAMQFVNAAIEKTNADINKIYANMPSFYGVDPQQVFQQHEEERLRLEDVSQYGAGVGAAYGAASLEKKQSAPTSAMPAPSESGEEESGTNEKGYYDEEDATSEDGSQTNEYGLYDDEEET